MSKKSYANMEKYRKTKKNQNRRYYRKTASIYPTREWTIEEDKLVLEHSISDSELSKKIMRSVAAIQKRRCILKK